MKFLTLVMLSSLSFSALAVERTEFDQDEEKVCYEKARTLGCVRGDGPADISCLQANLAKLPKKCAEVLGFH